MFLLLVPFDGDFCFLEDSDDSNNNDDVDNVDDGAMDPKALRSLKDRSASDPEEEFLVILDDDLRSNNSWFPKY